MLKFVKKLIVFSVFLLNSTNLFSGLLPGCIIFIGEDNYHQIRELRPGNSVMSLDERLNNNEMAIISGLKIHKNFLAKVIFIKLKSDEGRLSFMAVGDDQKFCILDRQKDYEDELSDNATWADAKDLMSGDYLRGYGDSSFCVFDIDYKQLKKNVDSYDLSLQTDHTFYIKDSNGNLVLTHNLFGVDDLVIIGGFCVIGALIGGGLTAYKTYSNGVFSKGAVVKGAVIGLVIGGVSSAAFIYIGVPACKYLPSALKGLEDYLAAHSPAVAKFLANVKESKIDLILLYSLAKDFFGRGWSILDRTTTHFADETLRRENEDIDFSGIDVDYGETEEIVNEIFVDQNDRPIRDENGNTIRFVLRRRRNV